MNDWNVARGKLADYFFVQNLPTRPVLQVCNTSHQYHLRSPQTASSVVDG